MPEFDADRATARENLYRLLAACYYEPGPEFAEERVFEAMREAAARLDPDLAARADRLAQAFAAASLEDLLLDYTRLFLGPIRMVAAPYGSVWLSGDNTLMQDSTVAVLELYRQGGFDLADEFRELPDHIAVELEFLYLLICNENRARRDQDSDALSATLALRKQFLNEHLGAWIDPFALAIQGGAETDFYRELAGLTQYAVAEEVARDP